MFKKKGKEALALKICVLLIVFNIIDILFSLRLIYISILYNNKHIIMLNHFRITVNEN